MAPGASPTTAPLRRLSCRGFRNLDDLAWEPRAGRHLILGPNGAGKTSLLEAVYVLATTRSFRAARVKECRRHGAEAFALAGRAGPAGEAAATELAVAWDGASGGLTRAVDGSPAPLVRHLAALPVATWTSAEEEMLRGGPSLRRRFLDQGLIGVRPGALEVLARYRQALEQKRRLLSADDRRGLAAWNEVLAASATELAALRADLVRRLAGGLRSVLDALEADLELELPAIDLAYRPSPGDAAEGAQRVLEALAAARSRELEQRRTLVGPHLDELEISWGGRELRRVASAGERKLAGLALVAARAGLLAAAGRTPVVLLDDLDSELDRRRLAAVWRLFRGLPQVLATSSREAAWEALSPDAIWRLEGGRMVSGPGIGGDSGRRPKNVDN